MRWPTAQARPDQGRPKIDNAQFGANLFQCGGLLGGGLRVTGVYDVSGEEDFRRVTSEVLAVLMQDVRLRAKSSGVPPTKFQCWANRAAVRSVLFSPLPPTQIGRWGR